MDFRQWIRQKKEWIIQNPDRTISVISLVFAIISTVVVGYLGYVLSQEQIRLGREQIRLAEVQIKMSEEQSHTAMQIDRFNELLVKIDTLITQQVALNKSFSEEIKVMIGLHDMNVDESNIRNRKKLIDRLGAYNDIVIALNELEPVINFFRENRTQRLPVPIAEIEIRKKILDTIFNKHKVFTNASYPYPYNHAKIMSMLDSSLNSINQYRYFIYYRQARGFGEIDTSYLGNKSFSDLIYYFLDLEDSILAHIYEAQQKVNSDLHHLDKVIESNDKRSKKR